MLQQLYPGYSKIKIKLDRGITVTLNFWKCFRVKESDIITYSLSDEYIADLQDPDYIKFVSYLKIDTTDEFWESRYGQVISEEYTTDCTYIYKFHYLIPTAEGDIMIIIPFNPIDFHSYK